MADKENSKGEVELDSTIFDDLKRFAEYYGYAYQLADFCTEKSRICS